MDSHVIAGALETMTANDWLIVCGIVIVIAIPGAIIENHRKKHPPKHPREPRQPRQPMDISPFTASLLSGQREQGYKPRGITAVTPSGIRVTVRCPHRSGHRSPDLAVACGQREKARIERIGR